MLDLFKRISEQWFLREPAFFSLYCTHQLKENFGMQCPVRSGEHRIEYNPALLKGHTQLEIETLMRIELMRIFLKHPYDRQPEGVSNQAKSQASDCCIIPTLSPTDIQGNTFGFSHPKDFGLEEGQHFEWYARRLNENPLTDNPLTANPSSLTENPLTANPSSLTDTSSLWQEDTMATQEINDLIKTLNNWGSIPGDVVQQIIASTQARIDYRLIMQGFRGQILSSKRRLTRMRPNRRTGFEQMGSARKFDTRLLVAVDVSGSIDDRTLCNFYGVINRFFRYGIDQIDCAQFDCALGPVKPLRKASRTIEITGRGGTSFQPIFDYVKENNVYDGIIILTDGGAAHPVVDDSITAKVLWICEDEKSYNQCQDWMQLFGRVCWMIL